LSCMMAINACIYYAVNPLLPAEANSATRDTH
jgi:hypothetical protein